jgi:hypothetical protein
MIIILISIISLVCYMATFFVLWYCLFGCGEDCHFVIKKATFWFGNIYCA